MYDGGEVLSELSNKIATPPSIPANAPIINAIEATFNKVFCDITVTDYFLDN